MFAVVCAFLVVVGGMVALLLGGAGVMSGDSCRPEDGSFLCGRVGQTVVFWLPVAGWVGSVAVAWLMVATWRRGRVSPWFGVAAGVAVYVAVIAIEWVVVAG